MITTSAKAEHATLTIKVVTDGLIDDKIREKITNEVMYFIKLHLCDDDMINSWTTELIRQNITRFHFCIGFQKIPSEKTIEKYRLMAKNAVEAKYNELKNPFDKWSVKA